MMDILEKIYEKSKKDPKKIVLVEGEEKRTLLAAKKVVENSYADLILLGNHEKIDQVCKKENISLDLSSVEIIDPNEFSEIESYRDELFEMRKEKGMTLEKADELLKEGSYLGVMLVHKGRADGCVSGAIHSTAETVRPAFQIIRTKQGVNKVSSYFLMIVGETNLIFSDCGINVDPSSQELSEIAHESAKSAKALGLEPKVAMLSFSTKGSASHPLADKVKDATSIAKEKYPGMIIDGELQLDTAIVPDVAKLKAKDSVIQGDANVLIFPDLNSGNIGYKLVQRLGGANAIGPVLQGLKKPINDLSRGCSDKDIVDMICLTSMQAQQQDR